MHNTNYLHGAQYKESQEMPNTKHLQAAHLQIISNRSAKHTHTQMVHSVFAVDVLKVELWWYGYYIRSGRNATARNVVKFVLSLVLCLHFFFSKVLIVVYTKLQRYLLLCVGLELDSSY
jgi:hypothetical protein